MATSGVAQSFGVLNYSGMLFNKGNTRTPLSSIIGSRAKVTDHVEFVTGQEYATEGGSQPNISETASLTAPDPDYITREQKTNVTQIFQETVGVSYGKMSNMGTLSGVNIAGQEANPMRELDFQVAAKIAKVNADIEFTFMQGVYNKAAADNQVNKTRGLNAAITSNVMDMDGKALGFWKIAELQKAISDGHAPIDDLTVWCDAVTLFQINADAEQNGMTIVPAAREINGIQLAQLITPLGTVNLYRGEYLPTGTAFLLNLGAIAPVFQPVPGKGNFFLEELAKAGAGEKYQLFGQIGLDHGMEWFHGKFTNLSTEFEAPKWSKSVFIAGGTVATTETDAVLESATLDKAEVEASDTAKVAVASVDFDVVPATDATLAYLWQIRTKSGKDWTDLTNAYTGYDTSELTVKAADAEKHYRCKVTASGSARGTVYTEECTVQAAQG